MDMTLRSTSSAGPTTCCKSQHGSLYPALHRLLRNGWISSNWEMHKTRNREFWSYRLTAAGRRQLTAEEQQWRRLSKAIASVMWPQTEE